MCAQSMAVALSVAVDTRTSRGYRLFTSSVAQHGSSLRRAQQLIDATKRTQSQDCLKRPRSVEDRGPLSQPTTSESTDRQGRKDPGNKRPPDLIYHPLALQGLETEVSGCCGPIAIPSCAFSTPRSASCTG